MILVSLRSTWIIFCFNSDRYEGTRAAEVKDVPRIEELLQPLEENGILIKRSREQVKVCFLDFLALDFPY